MHESQCDHENKNCLTNNFSDLIAFLLIVFQQASKLLPHTVLSYKPEQYFTLADLNPQTVISADDSVKGLPETPSITVLDVYDIAASIGKEFETIIDRYGPDSVANLMPKVISVLEELEDFAQRFDSEGRELIALQLAVQRLELEKLDRAQDQSRSEKVSDFTKVGLFNIR